MNKIFYPAIFHPEEVGYSVSVPDIDGCFSEGDTLEEAMDMISDAIGLCLEDCSGQFPSPSNPTNIQHDAGDFVTLIAFDMLLYRKKHDTKAVKKTLTIPSWLNTVAEEQHLNFSGILQEALKEHLHIN